jgi:hypothetical protein
MYIIATQVKLLKKKKQKNKGNAKHGVSSCLKIWPGDLDLWPWKSTGFKILLRNKHVPSLVKIHWRMLILEFSQGCYRVTIIPCDLDLWPWKSIGFQILLRTKYVPSLVKIHWRMLILVFTRKICSKKNWPGDLWPWKSIGFQIFLRTKYVISLVKIHWKMLILECSQGCYRVKIRPCDLDLWPMTLKINRVLDSPQDYVVPKFGQNPLKDVDSRVFTRMLWKDRR